MPTLSGSNLLMPFARCQKSRPRARSSRWPFPARSASPWDWPQEWDLACWAFTSALEAKLILPNAADAAVMGDAERIFDQTAIAHGGKEQRNKARKIQALAASRLLSRCPRNA